MTYTNRPIGVKAGSSNGRLLGWRGSAAWHATMNGCPRRWRG